MTRRRELAATTRPTVLRHPLLALQGTPVQAVSVSSDGRVLAATGGAASLHLADLELGTPSYTLPLPGTPGPLALTPSTVAVAVGRKVHTFNTLAGRDTGALRARGLVRALASTSDGAWWLLGDEKGEVRGVRVATGRRSARWRLGSPVTALAVAPTGGAWWACTADGAVHHHRPAEGSTTPVDGVLSACAPLPSAVAVLRVLPAGVWPGSEGATLVAAGPRGLQVLQGERWSTLWSDAPIEDLVRAPAQRRLWTLASGEVQEVRDGRPERVTRLTTAPVTALATHPAGQELVLGLADGTVGVWGLSEGTPPLGDRSRTDAPRSDSR